MKFGWSCMLYLWYGWKLWMLNFNESWHKWSFAFDAKMYAHNVYFYSFLFLFSLFLIRFEISAFVSFGSVIYWQFWLWLVHTNSFFFYSKFHLNISFPYLGQFFFMYFAIFCSGESWYFVLRLSFFHSNYVLISIPFS